MGFHTRLAAPIAVDCAGSPQLEIYVLYTSGPETQAALHTASQLADGLSSRIRLLALQCVPYPLPLDEPPVDVAFLRRTLADLCEGASVDIRLCRDDWDTLRRILQPQSVVVIGKRAGWWPRAEDRLARKLRAAGHHVIRTSTTRQGVAHVA